MKKRHRWTINYIPDQSGKTVVVTGANTGLGFEVALHLAKKQAQVILAVRSLERGQKALDKIIKAIPDAKVSLQELDLSSLESVRKAAREIKGNFSNIDILINNAGAITSKGKTTDGFELLFGVNYLGHFLFTNLLLDTLVASPNSRIVNVSSVIHHKAKPQWLAMDPKDTSLKSMQAYARSKLCNLLFTYELQRRLSGTKTICVAAHPGIAFSEVIRDFPKFVHFIAKLYMAKTEMGALPILCAAVDDSVLGGQYYGPHKRREHKGFPKIVTSSHDSYNLELQKNLWDLSERLINLNT